MASVTIEVDLPPDVEITGYERHRDGHGFEVRWPLPERCRCERCGHEDRAHIEFKTSPQAIRDLDVWGQPGFWIYQAPFHRCARCDYRQHIIPPFKRKDTAYTYRFEQFVLRSLIGSTAEDEAEKPTFASLRPGQSMHTIALADALELFKLPRKLGQSQGEELTVGIGPSTPDGLHVLDEVASAGYAGIDLGPVGYLGSGPELADRLTVIEADARHDAANLVKRLDADLAVEGVDLVDCSSGGIVPANSF